MMTNEHNKAIVRRFYEAFAADDHATMNALLAPDLAAYSHHAPGPMNRDTHVQGIRVWNAAFKTAFTVEEQLAEGDTVATRVTMRAVHSEGDFQELPPSGKQIVTGGISLERVKDGKIVERRVESDWLGMLQQIGLIPGTANSPSATAATAANR
jgi:predicted ester cyclase